MAFGAAEPKTNGEMPRVKKLLDHRLQSVQYTFSADDEAGRQSSTAVRRRRTTEPSSAPR